MGKVSGEKKYRNVDGLAKYRSDVEKSAKVLAEQAVKLSKNNLLSAKMSLWSATALVESRMKEMKKEGE